MKDITSEQMVVYSLALLLAVRCRSEEGTKQLLARFYHELSEQQARVMLHCTIMLLEPKERDWMRDLA